MERWRKGVIPELITGREHDVRGAGIRDIGNKAKIITLKKDCKCLILLELEKNMTDNYLNCAAAVDTNII